MKETWVCSLGCEDPLEKEMATHFSILAWKIPWTEKPGGLLSIGLHESDMTEATEHRTGKLMCNTGSSAWSYVRPREVGWGVEVGRRLKGEGRYMCVCALAQLCLKLCNPEYSSPSGFSVDGIFQARILKWVAMHSCRGSSQPGNRIHISCVSRIGRQLLNCCATWGACKIHMLKPNP